MSCLLSMNNESNIAECALQYHDLETVERSLTVLFLGGNGEALLHFQRIISIYRNCPESARVTKRHDYDGNTANNDKEPYFKDKVLKFPMSFLNQGATVNKILAYFAVFFLCIA